MSQENYPNSETPKQHYDSLEGLDFERCRWLLGKPAEKLLDIGVPSRAAARFRDELRESQLSVRDVLLLISGGKLQFDGGEGMLRDSLHERLVEDAGWSNKDARRFTTGRFDPVELAGSLYDNQDEVPVGLTVDSSGKVCKQTVADVKGDFRNSASEGFPSDSRQEGLPAISGDDVTAAIMRAIDTMR